jgi:hypothetical protein
MSERTVTEKDFRDVLKNSSLNPDHFYFKTLLDQLFPPPFAPKEGEVIIVSDYEDFRSPLVRVFSHMTCNNKYGCYINGGFNGLSKAHWPFAKAQTPKQRGEG